MLELMSFGYFTSGWISSGTFNPKDLNSLPLRFFLFHKSRYLLLKANYPIGNRYL